MRNETKDTSLPAVRVPTSLKDRLERIAEQSIARSISDHVRFAVEQYVAAEEAKNAEVIIAQS
jgi:predicted transcriptional regulator